MKMNTLEYWKQEAKRLEEINLLQSKFAIGHYYILLNDAAKSVRTYSSAIEIILKEPFPTNLITVNEEIACYQ